MNPETARRVLAEASRRAKLQSKIDFASLTFPQQRAFLDDPSKTKAALCSRRAGKSTGIAIAAIKSAYKHRNAVIPYITLTKEMAKRIMWQALQELNSRLNLGLKFNGQDGTVHIPQTGSYILLRGADDRQELYRLLGGKYPDVFIDECQSFRAYLEELIKEVLEPATMDYNGTIWMTGTPGPICAGYFYEATEMGLDGWDVHKWTWAENPFLPADTDEWLAKKMAKNGWTESTPEFLRWYKGVWVNDAGGLVYRIRRGITVTDQMAPVQDWRYVLGLDLGYIDSTAFVVFAYSVAAGEVHVVSSYKQKGLIPSAVAAHVGKLTDQYDLDKIIADTGGFGKGYAEELKQRYGFPVEAAQKRQKPAYIELLNGDLSAGIMHIHPRNRELLEEISMLAWDEDHKAPAEGLEDHLCDAMLYGWRYCRQYLHEDELNFPIKGTKEYWKSFEDKLEQDVIDRLDRQKESDAKPWWTRVPGFEE